MPLSEPVARELLHRRDIQLRGYQRIDGLFDIEARMTDTKTYRFSNEDRGWIDPGEALHDMWMRMTVDEDMVIVAFEASTDSSPYAICPAAAPNFARLAGLKIGRGFLRAAAERVGGTEGCTHLRELLQQMATVAFQTLYPVRMRKLRQTEAQKSPEQHPALLNTCLAYGTTSPVVARRWPHLYVGPDTGKAAE